MDAVHPSIATHLDAIRALCRAYGVRRLEGFNSAAAVDFVVHHSRDHDVGPSEARHFELQERLEALLGRPIDLVMASAMRKPRFIEAANRTRRALYAA